MKIALAILFFFVAAAVFVFVLTPIIFRRELRERTERKEEGDQK